MDIIHLTAYLLILGTVLSYIGLGMFPWRIYTVRDVKERLNLLEKSPRLWVLSQSIVILGGITAMVGSTFLTRLFSGTPGFFLAVIGALGFVLGHVFWIWHLVLRTFQPQKFAEGDLPAFLFVTYAILTPLALASFGAAFWRQGVHQVLGIGVIVAALLVLGLFLKYKDIPPFVFYAISLAIGLALLF